MSRRERPDPDNRLASFIHDWRQQLLSRRRFLYQAIAAATAAGAGPGAVNLFAGESPRSRNIEAGQADDIETAASTDWSELELQTLAAVQNQLFPAQQDSPGAEDINALAYLRRALEDPALAEDRSFIGRGIGWLDDLSASTFDKNFLQLDPDGREQLLNIIANSSAGENWLSTLLLYILEALLTDPVYGGNPEGVGWTWLQHAPGFPRPPAGKVYGKLG